MKENMNEVDRTIRFVAALAIICLYYMEFINGGTSTALLSVSALLFVTAIGGACPIYGLMGISTVRRKA